jgi:hypothetical protein
MTATVPRSAPRLPASEPDLVYGTELVPTRHDGRDGVRFAVRLPSYRGLPLSCIVDLEVRIDGVSVGSADLVLLLDGNAYPVAKMHPQRNITWFVLDVAELFVPLEQPLAPGQHEVEASLDLLTPFATVGRSIHVHTSRKTLPLADAADHGSVA